MRLRGLFLGLFADELGRDLSQVPAFLSRRCKWDTEGLCQTGRHHGGGGQYLVM